MFDDEDDEDLEMWWMDESETDKIIRLHNEMLIAKHKEYIRFTVLFDYFKSMYRHNARPSYLFYNSDNVKSIEKMLTIFLEKEEYEKCVEIRAWQLDILKHTAKSNKQKGSAKPITF